MKNTDKVATKTVEVINELGLHVRPSAILVREAGRFESSFNITKDDFTINGKSILGIMSLAACKGSKLVLSAEGADADLMIDRIGELFATSFDEA